MKHFCSTTVAVAVLLVCAPRGASLGAMQQEGRPNILFVYTDDQSHRTVSCYPEAFDWVRTPNIDRLAQRGIRFSYAYIGTWCMPSRATLLTGLHPYGVESMRMAGPYPGSSYDPRQCPFWPAVFREHGYVTGQIGKWHTGTDTGYGRDWDWQAVWNRPGFPENSRNYYHDQLISFNGAAPRVVKGYSTDNYTRWAVEFIRGKHRDPHKPWYLWLCYSGVHGPFTPHDRHRRAYPDVAVPVPNDVYPPRPGKPAYMQRVACWVKGPDGQPALRARDKQVPGMTLRAAVRQYHQAVLALDEAVGQLARALKETKQDANTLVVFTSDQGYAWGQHGFRNKTAPYDANLRAPLIVSMPGTLPEGRVCDVPMGGADLVPTFFRFAGIPVPWQMHGHDLTPLLHDPNSNWPHPVLLSLTGLRYGSDTDVVPTDPRQRDIDDIPWWVFLRKGRYKYIRTLVADEIEELYDLQKDPQELVNLALEPHNAGTLAEMRQATLAELRRTGAGMVSKLPPVRTAWPRQLQN